MEWNKLLEGELPPPHDIVAQMREVEQYWLGQAQESFDEGAFTIMDKQYEIWVGWNAYAPAYTCTDLDEALTVFAGAVKMCRPGERVEMRVVVRRDNEKTAYEARPCALCGEVVTLDESDVWVGTRDGHVYHHGCYAAVLEDARIDTY